MTDPASAACTMKHPTSIRPASDRPQSRQFESFSLQCLQAGLRIRFQARGASMSPVIRDGEMVYVKPTAEAHLRKGDIVLVNNDHGFRLHRLIRADAHRDLFVTRGDCGLEDDPAVSHDQILGVAVAKDVRLGTRNFRANFRSIGGLILRTAARTQYILEKILGPVVAFTLDSDPGLDSESSSKPGDSSVFHDPRLNSAGSFSNQSVTNLH